MILGLWTFLLFIVSSHCQEAELFSKPCSVVIKTVKKNTYGYYHLNISTPNVTVTCQGDTTLNGSRTVKCDEKTNQWNPPLPRCLLKCPKLPQRPLVISSANFENIWTDNNERRSGSTVSVQCTTSGYIVDGVSKITCKNGTWTPSIPKCKASPPGPDNRLLIILSIACPSGLAFIVIVIVIGKLVFHLRQKSDRRQQDERLAQNANSLSAYRVWTVGRRRKKIISANDLNSLKFKACDIFNSSKNKYTKIVLEEDGTEITSTSAMILSQDKTLMVLDKEDLWHPCSIEETEKLKLTYDVCSSDRRKRDLFLATSLQDLMEQVVSAFGHGNTVICLEVDGTCIDDDTSLKVVAGQPLIALKTPDQWKPPSAEHAQRRLQLLDRDTHVKEREVCYKVWTEDMRIKKLIFASDLVELHLKASKSLNLNPPIEILVFFEEIPIFDNDQLRFHSKDVLMAIESFKNGQSTRAPSVISSNHDLHSELPDVLPYPRVSRYQQSDTYF